MIGQVIRSCILSIPCKISSSKGYIDRIVKVIITYIPRIRQVMISDVPMSIESLGFTGYLNILPNPYTITDRYIIFFNILCLNKPQIRICNSIKTTKGVVLDLSIVGNTKSNSRHKLVIQGLLEVQTKDIICDTSILRYNTCISVLISDMNFFSVSVI